MKFPRLLPRFGFLAPPPPEGKKPTTRQLFDDTAIEQMVEALTAIPDPDEVLDNAGLTRADLRKMEYDDEIAAALETRLAVVLGTPWRLEPGEGQEVDFIWGEIEPVMESLITAAWYAVPYGYSVAEVIYRRTEEGRIGIDRVEERPFEWFSPRPTGELRYFPVDGGIEIDVDTRFKFLLTRRRSTYRNPYGQALLSRLYAPFFLRQAGWRFWPQFLERFGAPLLVGKTTGDTSALASALTQALQSAVVAVDSEDDVAAVASTGDGAAFERFETAVTKRIQKVILGQTLTTDVGNVGSYAAALVQDGVRTDRRNADLRMVTRTVQRLVNAITELNWPGAEPPEFVMEDETGLQTERAERDAKLVQSGVVKLTEDYLLRAYDFEVGDFELPQQQPTSPALPQREQEVAASSYFARPPHYLFAKGAQDRFTPEQEAVEQLADGVLAEAPSPISPAALARAVREARSPEELASALAAVYRGNQPDEFRAILERALFAADLMGYVHSEETNGE